MNSDIILIGTDIENPLIEITAIEYDKNKIYQKTPSIDSIANIASVAAQAAPALMTAKEIASKQIMEVVINGSLAKAADGNGLRAFSRDINGKFVEHARLYGTDKLSEMVNIAAVWQIASVVVAQKHLADINKKLENLQEGVDKIIDFLETERKTRLLAIYESLKEKSEILIHSTPNQRGNIVNYIILSKYDDELKKIYLHLKADIEKYGFEKTEHKEMFGTADLTDDLKIKIDKINDLLKLAFLCLSLRLVCCNFMDYSELESEKQAKEILKKKILDELEQLILLSYKFKGDINGEIDSMGSMVNKIQKSVKNNKGKVISAVIPGGTVVAVIGAVVGAIVDKNSEPELGILETRKKELKQKIDKFSVDNFEKYKHVTSISNQSIQSHIEKEQPIQLAFQKIDEKHVLCLNTGEKIAIGE